MTKVEVKHDWSANMWEWPLQHHDGIARVHCDANGFDVGLEAQFFKPDEIKVQVLNGEVHIDCLHQERSDKWGTVKREVHRAYHLPKDVDMTTIKSHLNEKGILHITAQMKK